MEILIVVGFTEEKYKYYKYICECLRSHITLCSKALGIIEANGYLIRIVLNEEKYWRGRRPRYHYGCYGAVDRYLVAVGSKRLVDLASVIEIVKG